MGLTERCTAQEFHRSSAQGETPTPPNLEAFLGSRTPTSIGTTKGRRGGQWELGGHCEVSPLSSGLQHRHQGHQKNLPTSRTSRSDFTGLLLRVFSTGHSFSWLHAQTLDVLLSCKNTAGPVPHQHHSRHSYTSSSSSVRLDGVCIFVFLVLRVVTFIALLYLVFILQNASNEAQLCSHCCV